MMPFGICQNEAKLRSTQKASGEFHNNFTCGYQSEETTKMPFNHAKKYHSTVTVKTNKQKAMSHQAMKIQEKSLKGFC